MTFIANQKQPKGERNNLSCIASHSPSLREAGQEISRSLKQTPWRNAAFWLDHRFIPNLLYSSALPAENMVKLTVG